MVAASYSRSSLEPQALFVTCSLTISLPRTVDPASTTPKPSIRQRFASAVAFCGMRSNDALWMNSTTAAVTPVGNACLGCAEAGCRRTPPESRTPLAPETGAAAAIDVSFRNSFRVMISSSRDRAARPPAPLAWRTVPRLEQCIQILAQPLDDLRVAIDRPLQQRAADERLDGAREAHRIAPLQLAGVDRFVEQRFQLPLHGARVRVRALVAIGIGAVDLQEGEAVRHHLRRSGHRRHTVGDRVYGGDRRSVRGPDARELGANAAAVAGGEGEQQSPLRTEPLDQRGRRDARFLRDMGQRQSRSDARHDAQGGAEDVGVGRRARPRASRFRDYKRSFTFDWIPAEAGGESAGQSKLDRRVRSARDHRSAYMPQ